ncbi:DUF1848 domain-containing protein [Verrucomicrobiota bacterium]
MSRIVSISRRTDIPAFYGAWFQRRLEEGFAGWENPFGGQRYLVSLKREDVIALVFWSKNYRPFLPVLERVRSLGYPTVFNYTISGLPHEFERRLVPTEDAVDSLLELSRIYSPDHVNWRYDPIVLSSITPPVFHEQRFAELCAKLHGHVKRCYFSYAIQYGKVARNYQRFEREHGVKFIDPPESERIELAHRLADIAAAHDIEMFTCCGDYLIDGRIRKAHCVDGDLISRLFYNGNRHGVGRPTRKECGCTESTDVGKYDTCPHGCIYCYANIDKEQAIKPFNAHDPSSAFGDEERPSATVGGSHAAA